MLGLGFRGAYTVHYTSGFTLRLVSGARWHEAAPCTACCRGTQQHQEPSGGFQESQTKTLKNYRDNKSETHLVKNSSTDTHCYDHLQDPKGPSTQLSYTVETSALIS